jgi:hypothetical protein
MSDEHRRQAEYTARAAADHGLDAELEKPTGAGTRVDVAVIGDSQVGFEIQRSTLSRAKAKSHAVKSFNAGWPTAWIHDTERDPDWAGHVPTARLTVRSGWAEEVSPRNTANVIIRRFWRERDKDFKIGWRFEHGPTTVLLDELSYLMPAGEIVPVSVGSPRTRVPSTSSTPAHIPVHRSGSPAPIRRGAGRKRRPSPGLVPSIPLLARSARLR